MKPEILLSTYLRKYPGIGKHINMFRGSRGKDLPAWPNWCFMPYAAWIAIVSDYNNDTGLSFAQNYISDVQIIASIMTWQYSKGIYEFDHDVLEELVDTAPDIVMPASVLYRIPEWCIYIPLPCDLFPDISGFYVSLEWDANNSTSELRLLLDTDKGLSPVAIQIGGWKISEGIGKIMDDGRRIGNILDPALMKRLPLQKNIAKKAHGFNRGMNSRMNRLIQKLHLQKVVYLYPWKRNTGIPKQRFH